jgi:hypothetical protein
MVLLGAHPAHEQILGAADNVDMDDISAMMLLKAHSSEEERQQKVRIALAREQPVHLSTEKPDQLATKALQPDSHSFVLNKPLRQSVKVGVTCKQPGCSKSAFAGGKCIAHA